MHNENNHLCKGVLYMKKILLMVMVTLLFAATAFAEDVDVAAMDYEHLLALKQAVDNEIGIRPEAGPRVLPEGRYVVGKAIKAGTYYVTVASFGSDRHYGHIDVYRDSDSARSIVYKNISLGETMGVTLEDGNILEIANLPLKFSITPFNDEEMLSYIPPEGTLVPSGTYRGGVEIPTGIYQVFPSSVKDSWIYIYYTEENFKNEKYPNIHGDSDEYMGVYVKQPEELVTLTVSEGNVFVFEGNVIMKKMQSQFTFD